MNRLIPVLAALSFTSAAVAAERVSVLVFDASGSMWNRVEGDLTRIEVARDVMGDYFATRDSTVPLSVIAYGHNRRGDCADIDVIAPMGLAEPDALERRLRALMPRGMTPLTDSLALAREQIPDSAETADIILVTDGLETCDGDPCALAARLASEGIDIRAHVVGFGLTRMEVEALSCITEQTGGMLFETNSGAELAGALQQVSMVSPDPVSEREPEIPAAPEAAFDIGDKAEAGFTYRIGWRGEARNSDFMGFVPQGENNAPSSPSFGPIGGSSTVPDNPATKTAPRQPGLYDLIIRNSGPGGGIIARQTIEVVAPVMGFDAIGSVEPGRRFSISFRGPEQGGELIVIASPDQPTGEHQRHDWAYSLSRGGAVGLTAPAEPGEYEIRYLNAARTEVMFSRAFGVGVPFEDTNLTTSADLAAQAANATRGDAAQDNIAAVSATFRLPAEAPQSDVSWDAVPLDADMSPEAWAPHDMGPVVSGEFEPGNWRVTAYAPGEVVLSADVAIFPGQANDFIVRTTQTDSDDAAASTLSGEWGLYIVTPWGIDAPSEPMLSFTLAQPSAAAPVTGRWTATAMLGGPAVEGRSGEITRGSLDEHDLLWIEFEVGDPIPEPFSLMVRPEGIGFSGGLRSGAMGIMVALWPSDYDLPPLDDLRPGVHGPAPDAD